MCVVLKVGTHLHIAILLPIIAVLYTKIYRHFNPYKLRYRYSNFKVEVHLYADR